MISRICKDLFVLELANNHWGNIDRGIKIIRDFGAIVKHNNIKAAIKFQIRDVQNFVHKDFKNHESRYIQKTLATEPFFKKGVLLGGFLLIAQPQMLTSGSSNHVLNWSNISKISSREHFRFDIFILETPVQYFLFLRANIMSSSRTEYFIFFPV